MDVFSSSCSFALKRANEIKENHFHFPVLRKKKIKSQNPLLDLTTLVWRVYPEHGANMQCLGVLTSSESQTTAVIGTLLQNSGGSFFCFCYGLNLAKISGLN